MRNFFIGCGVLIALFVLTVFILFSTYVGVYNTLNTKYQTVEGAKSQYSAALKVCSEKIKGVWEIANQYLDHESKTFREVTEARSGYRAAAEAFERALAEGKDVKELTQAGNGVVQAALAFRIQIEAYPQLRAVEAAQTNIRNLQEATNEIKTALDDWIVAIKQYNTYRGMFWQSLFGSFMGRFPSEIKYYEGEIKTLDVDSLNPEKKK